MSRGRRSSRRLARVSVAIAALATVAVFAAQSSAEITANLQISQPSTNVAGGTGPVTFTATFAAAMATPNDAVSDFSIALPPGMLINEMIAGGGCLYQPSPVPACQIGSGTATLAGVATPMTLYLMKPAGSSDLAGIFLAAGSFSLPGDLTMHSTSNSGINPSLLVDEEISFPQIAATPALTSLSLTLTGLSLPSSCLPSTAVLSADSQPPKVPVTSSAPYTLTGCLALAYSPGLTETVARDPAPSTGGVLTINLVTPPGDSSTQGMRLHLPPNVVLNPALDPCFSGEVCPVGTITAISPVLPSSQLSGSLTLAGTERAPTLAITFPPPLGLSLFTTFSATELNLLAVPDIPTTSLTLTFIGNSLGRMFTVLCYPTIYKAMLAPRSGAAIVNIEGAVAEPGCRQEEGAPAKPSATAAITGGGAKAVRLALVANAANGSPGIASLKIGLPAGLRFASGILSRGGKVARRALSVSGARIASVHLHGGALAVTFARATSHSRVSLASPLLVGSPKRHSGKLRLTITDGRGARTTLSVSLHG